VPVEWNIDDMSVPRYWKRAARELSERDVVLRKIIAATPGLTLRSRGDAFHTLARSIVGQQISVKAADSIWQKFNASVHTIAPHTVHKHNVDRLRTCGLSHSKITYLQDLSLHFLEKKLVPEKWDEMSDDQLIIELTKVKGIGRRDVSNLSSDAAECVPDCRSRSTARDESALQQGKTLIAPQNRTN